jgi:hypothetical protein
LALELELVDPLVPQLWQFSRAPNGSDHCSTFCQHLASALPFSASHHLIWSKWHYLHYDRVYYLPSAPLMKAMVQFQENGKWRTEMILMTTMTCGEAAGMGASFEQDRRHGYQLWLATRMVLNPLVIKWRLLSCSDL